MIPGNSVSFYEYRLVRWFISWKVAFSVFEECRNDLNLEGFLDL